MVDFGQAAKQRPVVVLAYPQPEDARALVVVVPLTSQLRGLRGEVDIGKPRWLPKHSAVNIQGFAVLASTGRQTIKDLCGNFGLAACVSCVYVYEKNMATKTITLELDAYERLLRAKRHPRESFAAVVRRLVIPEEGVSGRDLLAGKASLDFLSDEDLEAVDRINREDPPPDIP